MTEFIDYAIGTLEATIAQDQERVRQLRALKAAQARQDPHYGALYCVHANEMPHPCPCPRGCYCQVEGNCR